MSVPRTIGLAAGLAALLLFGGRAAWRALASDETRIRWLVADTASAFNDASVRRVTAALAADWVDATTNVDRRLLEQALAYAFLCRKQTGAAGLRIEVPDEELQVNARGERATATFRAILREVIATTQDEASTIWEVRVATELAWDHDHGWRFARSTHETLAGKPGACVARQRRAQR